MILHVRKIRALHAANACDVSPRSSRWMHRLNLPRRWGLSIHIEQLSTGCAYRSCYIFALRDETNETHEMHSRWNYVCEIHASSMLLLVAILWFTWWCDILRIASTYFRVSKNLSKRRETVHRSGTVVSNSNSRSVGNLLRELHVSQMYRNKRREKTVISKIEMYIEIVYILSTLNHFVIYIK